MVAQGTLAPAVRQTAIATLKAMNAYAKTKDVSVTMEPRWRADATNNAPWDVFVDVLKASGTYANPDCETSRTMSRGRPHCRFCTR